MTDNYGNDIAILILEKEVDISSYVMPACLDLLNEHVTSGQYEGYVSITFLLGLSLTCGIVNKKLGSSDSTNICRCLKLGYS